MLPDDLEHLHSFYLESNYITSIGNLEALSGISSKNHNFLVRHNDLETGEESALSNFVENVKLRNASGNPKLWTTPQFSLAGDRDQDGLPDGWEIVNMTDPVVPDAHDDRMRIYTNLEEYTASTNPQDVEIFPKYAPTAIHLPDYHLPENQVDIQVGLLFAEDYDSAGGFEVIDGNLTWHQARENAKLQDGYLATVINDLQQRMIPAKISADKVESFYWLGGSDEKEEGNWFWITGEAFDYQNWATKSLLSGVAEWPPSNSFGLEHFIQLSSTLDDGKRYWNDQDSSHKLGYILERNPTFALSSSRGNDNSKFDIQGNALRLTKAQDFEASSALNVRIKVTDRHGLSYEQDIACP